MTRVWERSSKKCRLPQEFSDLLPQGLQHEHLCFQNQPFLVPGSCNALSGSAIEQEYGDEKIYIHGINLFGRDCGYGEPAVGIRLSAHKAWLESVLLPHLKSESLVYIDPDLELGDECEYADGTKGICEAKQSCPAIHTRLQYKQQISFCSNGTVVCCSSKATNPRMMAIEKELNECEERYRHLRTDQYNERSHTVEIGWQDDRNTTYECFGYLISTRGIVSSASCLSKRGDLPNIVRLGGNDSLDNSRVITIDRVIIHPNYNKKTLEHNIAIVRLETALDPTKNAFPTCLWQNLTHSPKGQIVMDFASGSTRLVNPMYKSDCEALLNRTFEGHYMLCMNSGWRMFYPKTDQSDLQVHFEANEDSSYDNYFEAGSPIVSKPYLVHVYSHGSCNLNTPCVVARIAAYIEWFKEVLQ
uniref:Peptidase S1 domain-containing protein n=1 Tax=Anopheles quadriannulatus TaxID=34691 RepID=A0A182X7W3_ANOQN